MNEKTQLPPFGVDLEKIEDNNNESTKKKGRLAFLKDPQFYKVLVLGQGKKKIILLL